MQYCISGRSGVIDTIEWERNTVYHNVDETDIHVKWFWEIVNEMDEEMKSKLLKFSTGLIKAPFFGFESLNPKFAVMFCRDGLKRTEDGMEETGLGQNEIDERLPTSSTCSYLLKMPMYSSKEVMKNRLITAITSNAGFDLA